MRDIKNGSPKTKEVSKVLFSTYQEMGRSKRKYDDKFEMLAMFSENDDGYKESFNSIEAHDTFKTIEE